MYKLHCLFYLSYMPVKFRVSILHHSDAITLTEICHHTDRETYKIQKLQTYSLIFPSSLQDHIFAIVTHKDSLGCKSSTVNVTRAGMGLPLEHRIVSAIFILDTTFHHFLLAYHPFSGHLTPSRSRGKTVMQPRHPPSSPCPSTPGVPDVSQDFVRSEGTHNPFNVSSGVLYPFEPPHYGIQNHSWLHLVLLQVFPGNKTPRDASQAVPGPPRTGTHFSHLRPRLFFTISQGSGQKGESWNVARNTNPANLKVT